MQRLTTRQRGRFRSDSGTVALRGEQRHLVTLGETCGGAHGLGLGASEHLRRQARDENSNFHEAADWFTIINARMTAGRAEIFKLQAAPDRACWQLHGTDQVWTIAL